MPACAPFCSTARPFCWRTTCGCGPSGASAIQRLVREGRLQVGPWYVLADELIPSGESLVRNLLVGRADALRLGGRSEALYSPDAFGHPAVWPTLAAQFGLPFGALWRGVGGEPGQDGDLYRWRGPDGSEVLLYHLPPAGYEIGASLPSDWEQVRQVLTRRAATPHIAVLVGADHHAVHPDLGGLRESLAALEPDAEVRVSRLDEFLAEAARWADRCPEPERRAAVVVRLHLDPARRARHSRAAQATAWGSGAVPRAGDGAARRPAPASGRDGTSARCWTRPGERCSAASFTIRSPVAPRTRSRAESRLASRMLEPSPLKWRGRPSKH